MPLPRRVPSPPALAMAVLLVALALASSGFALPGPEALCWRCTGFDAHAHRVFQEVLGAGVSQVFYGGVGIAALPWLMAGAVLLLGYLPTLFRRFTFGRGPDIGVPAVREESRAS